MECRDPAEAGRASRVAVVSMIECREAATLRMTGQLMELHRHLQRHLDGRGPIVGIENTGQRFRREEGNQPFRQPDGRFVGRPEERAVREFSRLRTDGRGDFRMRVTVDVGPDGTVAVQVFATFAVDQHASAPFGDDERIVSGITPVAHLGERVPDMLLVGCLQFAGAHGA